MNNEELIDVKTLRPFRRFIYTIGALPSSYLISMTYEEQLIWLCNYLEKTVIPAINNNGLAVEELQAKYIELKSYVDNYFDNLDIQEEINNKLDEMVESGELENLISQYIQLATTYVYNNINEMKEATNLVNGSFARTSGFYEYNDGGGALYKVRTITNEDVIDNITIIALSDNTLIAELQKQDLMNVKQFGAKGDGETDDTLNINKCIDFADNIIFDHGTYLINPIYDTEHENETCINLKSNKIIDLNNATITMNETDEMLYYIFRAYQVDNFTIKNGFIVGYDTTEQDGADSQGMGIAIMDCSNVIIENMNIKNCRGDGIYIREYSNQKKTNNVYVNNCIFKNNRRNQIGYTGGENIKITNCDFIFDVNEPYTSNWVGIDLERDHDYARFENFYINNCNFNGQPKAGISLSPVDNTIPCYGTIENCNIENCSQAIIGTRGGRSQDSVFIKNINITGCTLPPIHISRATTHNSLYFENIVLNSFNYTGGEDMNYMFYMPGLTSDGVGKVHIFKPVCKANCSLVFMNNGIKDVSIIDPIFQNGSGVNSWGVLHGRTQNSNLILKDSYNQVRMNVSSNYENSNVSVPSNILINGQNAIINITIIRNLLCDGNEITIFNKGIYKANIILQGNRQITIPEYQGYCKVIKMNDELMFYGNLTKWENLPQS